MTSATSSSGPRSRSTRRPPRSPRSPTRCRRSSTASRCASATILINLDRPASPSTRPTATRSRSAPRSSATKARCASRSTPFQVANCGNLAFGPKLTLSLTGGVNRSGPSRRSTPTSRAPAGNANIARAAVTLPSNALLDQANIAAPCTRPSSPPTPVRRSTQLGSAVAKTPLLDGPLSGPVYLVTSSNKLPDLLVQLHGQVDINLRARIDQVKGALRTTFENVPDVAVSDFRLDLAGGAKKGLIVNSESMCAREAQGQGRDDRSEQRPRAKPSVPLAAKCAKASRHGKRGGSSR